MKALLLIPAFCAFIFMSACIKAYIPFVSEPAHDDIIRQGRALYPDLFYAPSETEKIGRPSVNISVEETSDISMDLYDFASHEINLSLSSGGFSVQEKNSPDIKIRGRIYAAEDSKSEFGGFLDYNAQCDIIAEDARSGKIIALFNSSVRGLGLSPKDASSAALANAGREIAKRLSKDIISYYRNKSIVRLEIYNLTDLPQLNAFYVRLKSIKGVDNAWLIDYRGGNAYFDVSCASGGAGNLARGLMETYGTLLKINRPSLMKLEASMQRKN